ncbi:MAG TPA: nucleoside permease [Vicinamibacteria bacterium]|nr:nucleoside permease [Vicinamibacteria bacterium]
MHATLPQGIRARLSLMMFLQFFIWGAWFVTLGTYLLQGLQFTGTQTAQAYSTMPWGAIVAPFVVGMVADRFFPAERMLGVLHLAGAGLLYLASTVTRPEAVFWVLLGYALCYNPTLALVNAVSFNQMASPERQFPAVRVFGTLGWIVAGFVVGLLLPRWLGSSVEATAIPLRIAAGSSMLLGLLSFALPHTPPKSLGHRVTVRDVLGLDALGLMKDRSFAVFVAGSLLICVPLAFYYGFTNPFLNEQGVTGVAWKMTMGQMSEVVFMLVMPFFFARLGVKWMLIVGMLAWAVRYVLFAFGNADALVFMYYAGILLHGICYDFFFVTGQIYVEKTAPKSIQASAQGFITLITYGVGMLIGNWVAGPVVDRHARTVAGAVLHDWPSIWLWPAVMASVVIVLFAALFRERRASAEATTPSP